MINSVVNAGRISAKIQQTSVTGSETATKKSSTCKINRNSYNENHKQNKKFDFGF